MALMRIYGNRKGARGTFLPTYIFLFQEKRDHIDTIRHFFTIYSVCKGQGSFLHLDTGRTACYIRIHETMITNCLIWGPRYILLQI